MIRTCVLAATLGFVSSAASAETTLNAHDLKNANVLERLYPKRALAAGEQGRVYFTVTLDAGGNPTGCQVTESSGYPRLDEETCAVITENAIFGHNDSVATRSGKSTHEGVINWRLPANAASPAASPSGLAVAAPSEKLICKRERATGSLARYTRVCATATEWARAAHELRESLQENARKVRPGF